MLELELSIMSRGPQTAQRVQQLLAPFAARHRVQIHLNVLNWDTGWAELVKTALYGHGPDISEIGSTWVGNLMGMNALRPFASAEVAALGGEAAFLRSAWQSGQVGGGSQLWAVPWLADTRVIYYRRDWLARAGLDEKDAFSTATQLEQTLAKLVLTGVAHPWAVPTLPTLNTLHNVVSWVWGAGGDFVSNTGRQVLFHQPAAVAGLCAYYDLHRYLAGPTGRIGPDESNLLFRQGIAGVILSGPWTMNRLLNASESDAEVRANFGVALPPGDSFVGGSHLIIWKHTHQARLALELIQYLTSQATQSTYIQMDPELLPVRYDALEASPLAQHPGYHLLSTGARFGRSFPSLPRWGLVEDKLASVLNDIWADLHANAALDLDAHLRRKLDPLAKRLEYTLQQ